MLPPALFAAALLLSTWSIVALQPPSTLLVAPGAPPCLCVNTSSCATVQRMHSREVFGFAVSRDTPYDRYDWTQLTTLAWNDDPALVCTAHAAGARVVLIGRGANSPAVYGNATARAAWIAQRVRQALDAHLDGINFDLEDPLEVGDPLAVEYSQLVREAAEAFHAAIPGSQVSVDVPWSPHGVDGRNYEWPGLAAAADLVFVMAYDMQSQIWGRCVASANSPLPLVRRGVRQWVDLGVPASKLVLGLPWYGYLYPCTNTAFHEGRDALCALRPVPFRGCPCSDAAGRQLCYSDIRAAMRRGDAGVSVGRGLQEEGVAGSVPAGARPGNEADLECEAPEWDSEQSSPFTRCHLAANPQEQLYQVWYDDPSSMALKYGLAAYLGLRGVGVWNLDCLDYRSGRGEGGWEDTRGMWDALRAFTGREHPAMSPPVAAGAGGDPGVSEDIKMWLPSFISDAWHSVEVT